MADDPSELPPALPPRRHDAPAALVLLIVILLANAYFRAMLLDVPLERDEGEYAYGGQRLLAGVSPYDALYSMKFPGIYVIYAIIEGAFGQTPRAIHAGLLIATTMSIVLVFLLGQWWRGSLLGAGAAGCFAALAIAPRLEGIAAQTESFLLPLVLGGVLLLVTGLDRNRLGWLCGAGICLGAAITVKQHAAVFLGFAVAAVWVDAVIDRPRSWRPAATRTIALLSGTAIPLALMAGLLAWSGDLRAFWYWTFSYAANYATALSFPDGWTNFRGTARSLLIALPVLWLLAAWGMIVAWRDRDKLKRTLLISLWAAFSALSVCPGLYFRHHYFLLITPVVALTAAVGIESFARWIGFGDTGRTRIATIVLFWAVPLLSIADQVWLPSRMAPDEAAVAFYSLSPFSASVEVGDYLRDRTSPGDCVAVVGSEPQIYFYAQRPAATRYVYMYELMQPHPRAEEMQREMIGQIESARPEYLVYAAFPLSWLARDESPRIVHTWLVDYLRDQFELAGIVEVLGGTQIESHWGDAAKEYRPRTANWFSVWRRRDADAGTRPGA